MAALYRSVSHTHTHTHTHTSVFNHGLHRSSGNGFQRRTFPFLWVPELSPCYIYIRSRLTIKVKVTLRPTVSRSVCQTPIWGPIPNFLLSNSCGFVDVGRLLRQEDKYDVYNCCWPSSAQLSLRPSPAGLMAIFYCLRFDIPPTWRARFPYLYPPGTGWPSYTPGHWVPFPSPLTTRRATAEVY
jgi:hypothetical protein